MRLLCHSLDDLPDPAWSGGLSLPALLARPLPALLGPDLARDVLVLQPKHRSLAVRAGRELSKPRLVLVFGSGRTVAVPDLPLLW